MEGIERMWGRILGSAGPGGSELNSKFAMGRGTREYEDFAAEMERKLEHEMGRGSEPVETQAVAFAGTRKAERAVPDDAGAQERRSVFV